MRFLRSSSHETLGGSRQEREKYTMSIAGILSSSLFSSNSQAISPQQQFQKEFQQLGQALQSGNLSAAQADFASLQQNSPSSSPTTSASTASPIAQAFSQLGKDLQSGNLPAAQQDFSNIRQDTQSQSTQAHHHHHHHGGGGGGGASSSQSTLSQEFAQLGQDLQAGNVSAAQKAYSAVQQSFAAFGANSASAATLSSLA
jgi:outer membrane protein assembly factor BamD (BamD/ComL family)